MKLTTAGALASTTLFLSLALAAPQTRAKPKEQRPFSELLAAAGTSFEAGQYRETMAHLAEASGLARLGWRRQIRAALPAAPAGYTLQAEPEGDPLAELGAMGGMGGMAAAMGMGNMIEAVYQPAKGSRVTVTVQPEMPMVGMMTMMFTNPAMLEDDQEIIEYGEQKALLENRNGRLELQILIAAKHMVTVNGFSDEEALFAMWDQTAVDALAAALGD